MIFVRLLLALAVLAGTSCVMVPPGPRVFSGVKVEKAAITSLDGKKEIRADVYLPKGKGPHPGVLLLHGGGINDTGGKWQMAGIAGKLANRGYVVVNTTYRSAPAYQYPVPLDDTRAALEWMRANAGKYGIDRSRMATFGYSAGGYLASLVALTDDAPKRERIKAIVTGGAPTDMVFYAEGKLVPDFLGGKLYEVPEKFYDASPANHVNRNSPPIFIYHGMGDRLVRPEHPLLMVRKYQDAGVKCETFWMWNRGHIEAFFRSGPAVERAIDFLDREL